MRVKPRDPRILIGGYIGQTKASMDMTDEGVCGGDG